MFEGMYDNLPWWLKPASTDRVKNTEIAFEGGTRLWVESGKAMKGTAGQRGQIGRGLTISTAHLSEISTWEQPEPIKDSLLPAMPRSSRTFVFMESTAKGRGDWWHTHWQHSPGYIWKFLNIFIPWYVELKYSEPAPPDWAPSKETLQHAKRIEETSPRWVGKVVVPTRDQLYWWELAKYSFQVDGKLKQFLEEFGAITDDECFQLKGDSIFSVEAVQRLQSQARPIAAVVEVGPQRLFT